MPRLVKTRSRKAGLPPGTPMHIGEKKSERTRIRVLHYDESQATEKEIERIEDCAALRAKAGVSWIHVTGVHDVSLLEKLGQCFGLHPLVLEDISNTDQRPKMEDYGDSFNKTEIRDSFFCRRIVGGEAGITDKPHQLLVW